eukprot:359959-Chlamydomonas_euryale.AAC.6
MATEAEFIALEVCGARSGARLSVRHMGLAIRRGCRGGACCAACCGACGAGKMQPQRQRLTRRRRCHFRDGAACVAGVLTRRRLLQHGV